MSERTTWTDVELADLRLEGIEYLNRLLSGEANTDDAADFLAWRSQSPAHEEAFRSAVKLRNLVRHVEGAERQPLAAAENVIAFARPRTQQFTRRAVLGGAIAASAAGILVLGRSMEFVPSLAEMGADHRTGPGERRTIALADGATIELNTRTSIGVRANGTIPTIELIKGEAVLTSGRSGKAALIAGKATSIGHNGRFVALRGDEDVCITCLSGEVEVDWDGERRPLRATQQVRYTDAAIGPVSAGVDTAVLTSWQSGTLIFQDMPLRQVVAEINRYRSGRVVLANDALAGRRLTGTYQIARIDEFFGQARLAVGAKITTLPGGVVVLS